MTQRNLGGRPALDPDEKLHNTSIPLNNAQRAKVKLYGPGWVRDMIDRGKPPKDWQPPAETPQE